MLKTSSILVTALAALTACTGPAADPAGTSTQTGSATTGSATTKPEPVPTAGPDTGDLLVHGTLTADGEAVVGGRVWVGIMPEDEDMEVGETVAEWRSDVSSTDGEGRFAVEVGDQRLTSDLFNGDYLNYGVYARHEDRFGMWYSTAHLVGDGVWRSAEDALVGDPVVEVALDLQDERITLTDSFGDAETHRLPIATGVPDGSVVPG